MQFKIWTEPDVAAHTCNPSTGKVEAGKLKVHGQSGQHSKFQTSLGYIARPCLKKKKKLIE
jgi:hypothetical protein